MMTIDAQVHCMSIYSRISIPWVTPIGSRLSPRLLLRLKLCGIHTRQVCAPFAGQLADSTRSRTRPRLFLLYGRLSKFARILNAAVVDELDWPTMTIADGEQTSSVATNCEKNNDGPYVNPTKVNKIRNNSEKKALSRQDGRASHWNKNGINNIGLQLAARKMRSIEYGDDMMNDRSSRRITNVQQICLFGSANDK